MKNYLDGGDAIVEAFRKLGVDCSPSAPMAQIWGCDLRRIWVSSK